MHYDKYLARAHRAAVRYYFALRKAPDKQPAEPVLVIKPAAFVRAFVTTNPSVRRHRKHLLDHFRGRLLIFTERRWLDRIQLGRELFSQPVYTPRPLDASHFI